MRQLLHKILLEPMNAFVKDVREFLPNLLSSIIILIIGLFVAYVCRAVVIKLLNIFNAERFFEKMGLTNNLKRLGVKETATRVIGRAFYWTILFIFLIIALYAMKVPAVDAFLRRLLLYLPNLFVSIIIVILGSGIGNFLSRAVLVGAVNAGLKHARWLSYAVKVAILVFVTTMALEQLGIGRETVLTAFSIVFGGVVFAFALAFGLATKDLLKEYIEKIIQSDKTEDEEPDELKHL